MKYFLLIVWILGFLSYLGIISKYFAAFSDGTHLALIILFFVGKAVVLPD